MPTSLNWVMTDAMKLPKDRDRAGIIEGTVGHHHWALGKKSTPECGKEIFAEKWKHPGIHFDVDREMEAATLVISKLLVVGWKCHFPTNCQKPESKINAKRRNSAARISF